MSNVVATGIFIQGLNVTQRPNSASDINTFEVM